MIMLFCELIKFTLDEIGLNGFGFQFIKPLFKVIISLVEVRPKVSRLCLQLFDDYLLLLNNDFRFLRSFSLDSDFVCDGYSVELLDDSL